MRNAVVRCLKIIALGAIGGFVSGYVGLYLYEVLR